MTTFRFNKATISIGGEPLGGFSAGEYTFEEDTSEPEPPTITPLASFSFETTSVVPAAGWKAFMRAIWPESRKMAKRLRRFERMRRRGARVAPLFCGLCVRLGRAKPFLSQYGLRMHLAQGNHGTSTNRHALDVRGKR